ncbi:hypothetical protein LTS18_004179, partial [Coniosporium uncinatum]
ICGTRTPDAARAAIEAGADLIGVILVQGRKRCVDDQTALEISRVVHDTPTPGPRRSLKPSAPSTPPAKDNDKPDLLAQNAFRHAAVHKVSHPSRALLVGVFQNQPLPYVLAKQKEYALDVVQLHGDEPVEWSRLIPCSVLRAFKPDSHGLGVRGYHALPLLDSGHGGTGEVLDLSKVKDVLSRDEGVRVLLAGGLGPENVGKVVGELGELGDRVVGVDVSSGVEGEAGGQDVEKIRAFVAAAKGL